MIVAIDDVQWMDGPSAQALSFAVRRLGGERVGVLATLRQAPGLSDPLDLDDAVDGRTSMMNVGPLSVVALGSVLRSISGDMSRPLLVRVHEVSEGNPLFALEIFRALQLEVGELERSEPLPVPEDLGRLLHGRIERFPRVSKRRCSSRVRPLGPPWHLCKQLWAGRVRTSSSSPRQPTLCGFLEAGCRSRILCSHPLCIRERPRGAGAERISDWPRSSRTMKSEHGTSRSHPSARMPATRRRSRRRRGMLIFEARRTRLRNSGALRSDRPARRW